MTLMQDYYKKGLSANGQQIYDLLSANIHSLAKDAYVEAEGSYTKADLNDAVKAYMALRKDRPEFYFLDNRVEAAASSRGKLKIRQRQRFTFDQIKRMNAILRWEISEIVDKSSYQDVIRREREIYRNIASRYCYMNGEFSHDLSGLLMFRQGVCESISGMLVVALRVAGLPAIKVHGMAKNERHSWTMVWIGGKPYHLDVTWDLSEKRFFPKRYRYFNLTEDMICRDHVMEKCEKLDFVD